MFPSMFPLLDLSMGKWKKGIFGAANLSPYDLLLDIIEKMPII